MKRSTASVESTGISVPSAKRQLMVHSRQEPPNLLVMNAAYKKQDIEEKLTSAWRGKKSYTDCSTNVKLLNQPFQCCVLPSFITTSVTMATRQESTCESSERYLESLKDELLRLKFYEKNNDLYQFRQSDDLKKFGDSRHISALSKYVSNCSTKSLQRAVEGSLLLEDCLPWLRNVTGLELTDTVDITCSKYEYTDVLLCHDDELEGRRIAFILYLVPEWTVEDGGTLDLFDVNDRGQPHSIVESLVPVWNNFVFFDVNAVSFHQVSEVLTAAKTRLSVSGWFHGPPPPRPTPYKEGPPPLHPPLPMELEALSDWVNPMYLDIGVQSQIQAQFEEESQIELPNFLLEDKYKQICEELSTCERTVAGPPNKRRVHQVSTESAPSLQQLTRVFPSRPFCLLLSHLTGLDLVENVIRDAESVIKGHSLSCSNNDGPSTEQLLGVANNSFVKNEKKLTSAQNGNERIKVSTECCKKRVKDSQPNSEDTTNIGNGQPNNGDLGSNEGCFSDGVALCRCDVYNWCHGDYTLAGEGVHGGEFVLDTRLHCCSEEWSPDNGGVVSYIAKDVDEELLSICPRPNALSLVYKDPDTLCFTKYINHRSCGGGWLSTIQTIYVENSQP